MAEPILPPPTTEEMHRNVADYLLAVVHISVIMRNADLTAKVENYERFVNAWRMRRQMTEEGRDM